MPSLSSADVQPKFIFQWLESAFKGSNHARRDAGGMPVHSHDSAERLEPERVREAAKELVTAIVVDNSFANDGSEPRHAGMQPRRHVTGVQRQISTSTALCHAHSSNRFVAFVEQIYRLGPNGRSALG